MTDLIRDPDDDLCKCDDCLKGDALPIERHGIPGARQIRLVVIDPLSELLTEKPELR